MRLWDVSKPDAAVLDVSGHTGSIKKVMFSPDGNSLISAGDDKVIRVWDKRSGSQTKSIPLGSALTGLEISPDGTIMTATHGMKVDFYDAEKYELIKSKTMEAPVYSASLHPDKKTFVWGGIDNMLHVVDYESMEQQEEYKGHFGEPPNIHTACDIHRRTPAHLTDTRPWCARPLRADWLG